MNDPFSTTDPGSADTSLEASKKHALQAAEELRAAAGAKAQQLKQAAEARAGHFRDVAETKADEIRGFAETSWDDARHRANDWKTEGERYIRQNPGQSVLAALGVGFVLGLLLRR